MKHTYVTVSGQTVPLANIDYIGAPELRVANRRWGYYGRWGYYIYFKSHHKILVGDNHDGDKVKQCHDKLTEALESYFANVSIS